MDNQLHNQKLIYLLTNIKKSILDLYKHHKEAEIKAIENSKLEDRLEVEQDVNLTLKGDISILNEKLKYLSNTSNRYFESSNNVC